MDPATHQDPGALPLSLRHLCFIKNIHRGWVASKKIGRVAGLPRKGK